MKCCSVFVDVIRRIGSVYILSTRLFLYCVLQARVTCKRQVNALLHYKCFWMDVQLHTKYKCFWMKLCD